MVSRVGLHMLHGGTTVETVALGDGGVLVWLADASGEVLSNRVPLDAPDRLYHILQARASTANDRPRELDAGDIGTPVGAMLLRLQRECVFDFDDLPVTAGIRGAADAADDEIDEFWETYMREQLRLDPRYERYRPLTGRDAYDDNDPIFARLQAMLDEVRRAPTLRAISETADANGAGVTGAGTPWAPERRLQVRLFNALEQWSRALSDPRLRMTRSPRQHETSRRSSPRWPIAGWARFPGSHFCPSCG